jgi:hypothetical protein
MERVAGRNGAAPVAARTCATSTRSAPHAAARTTGLDDVRTSPRRRRTGASQRPWDTCTSRRTRIVFRRSQATSCCSGATGTWWAWTVVRGTAASCLALEEADHRCVRIRKARTPLPRVLQYFAGVLACPCGKRMRYLATLFDRKELQRPLTAKGLPHRIEGFQDPRQTCMGAAAVIRRRARGPFCPDYTPNSATVSTMWLATSVRVPSVMVSTCTTIR